MIKKTYKIANTSDLSNLLNDIGRISGGVLGNHVSVTKADDTHDRPYHVTIEGDGDKFVELQSICEKYGVPSNSTGKKLLFD